MNSPICINSLIIFVFVIALINLIYNRKSFDQTQSPELFKQSTMRITKDPPNCMERALKGECWNMKDGKFRWNWNMRGECNNSCKRLYNIRNSGYRQGKIQTKKEYVDEMSKMKIQNQYDTNQMKQDYEQEIEDRDEDITQYESNLLDRNIEILRLDEKVVNKQNNIDEITAQYANLESDIKAKRTQSYSRQQL